jgi:rod shape-determining protein MreD
MSPPLSIAEKLIVAARMVLPYSVLALLFFMELASAPYPFSAILRAPFFLMALYFWSIHRPGLIPPWLVFVSGLVLDLLSGVPLGLNAMLFVLVRLLVVDQRRLFLAQSFVMMWLGFALVDLGYHLVQWALFSLLSLELIPLQDVGPGLFLGIVFFPLVSAVLYCVHRLLPGEDLQSKSGLGSQRKGMPL